MGRRLGPPSPLLVLLVDADVATRQMYAEALRLASFDVEQSGEGRDALAKALSVHHDLIITETRLPGLDGYKFCTLLRRDPTTRSIPLVVVTSETRPSDVDRAERAGADIVLAKPCVPETLIVAVRRAIDAAGDDVRRSATIDDSSSVRSDARPRMSKARAHVRGQTTAPPHEPPVLVCPACDGPLVYELSHVGGVSAMHPEQWDVFQCPAGCGSFEYRQRTRQLRRV